MRYNIYLSTQVAVLSPSSATTSESAPTAAAEDPAFEWVYLIFSGWVASELVATVYTGVGAGAASTDVSSYRIHDSR